MLDLLWLVPAIPLASALILLVFAPRSKNLVAVLGVGSIAVDAVVSLIVAAAYPGSPYTQTLWTWIDVGGFRPQIAFYLDPLSLVMTVVVTCVGFLIHLYSAEFMREDEGYSRFFGYMNLFVASMLTLLLGDNLLLLFLGWEGVGLCSYLLIGFWYRDPVNGRAGQKAFIVTRVGDTALTIGLLLLFTQLGTLHIQELMQRATVFWPIGSTLPVAAAALIVGGAIGKSAQVPLQTWLPDAMAGPTPTSALIHAATMVTAGVYLIARTHRLFYLAPQVQTAVAVIGIVTLLMAGFSALTQSRYQARARLLHRQPDRLYVPGAGRGRLGAGDLPLHDPRLLQGAALPCGRRRHRSPAPRAQHLQYGRAAPAPAAGLLDVPGGRRVARRAAARHRRLLQQRPHHLVHVGLAPRPSRALGAGHHWRAAHFALHLPPDLPGVLRPGAHPGRAGGPARRSRSR